jgi:hypothetical protein
VSERAPLSEANNSSSQRHITLMKTTAIKRQSSRYLLLTALGVAMSLTFGMSTARGELLFSDSFDYPAGPLAGDGPPAGSPPGQTGWTLQAGDPQVHLGGLHFPHVFRAGNAATFMDAGSNGDNAIAGLSPVNSGIVWIGFLIREVSGRPFGYAVLNVPGLGNPGPGFGLISEHQLYGIDNDTGSERDRALTTTAPSPTPVWLVVKLDFDAGTESLFVNPSVSAGEPDSATPDAKLPMTAAFRTSGFSQIVLNDGYNNGGFAYDEVRVGTTFFDVRTGE